MQIHQLTISYIPANSIELQNCSTLLVNLIPSKTALVQAMQS
jgi:hypothetical protein